MQETLDRVSKGRTTIVVSHRLSAIRNADRIVFIDKGHVIEDGTHSELMTLKGRYYEMITAGNMEDEHENELIEDNVQVNEHHEDQQKITTKQLFNDQNDGQNYFRVLNVDDMEKDLKPTGDDILYWNVFKRIVRLTKPEWFIMFVAAISAISIGASLPIFAVLFAEVYGVNKWCL